MLQRPCPDCGFDTTDYPGATVPAVLHAANERWSNLLARPGIADRPAPGVWSPLEYICHVRDVCVMITGRAQRMLAEDDPELPVWDQDEAAVRGRYAEQDPALVDDELADAADAAGALFAGVGPEQWSRPGPPQRRHRVHRRDPGPVPRPRGRAPPARRARLTCRDRSPAVLLARTGRRTGRSSAIPAERPRARR